MISKAEHLKALSEVRKSQFSARVDDLNALREEFGQRVEEVVRANRAQKLEVEWHHIAEAHGRNDIQGMKETLWQWVLDAGIEYEFEDTAEGTQVRVTRCPLAEMAREIGAADWGSICFCADDPAMVAGFNPKMGFRRTKTLMEGDDYCDHFYFMKE
jgi:predicted ArsR family transcriptional regulator